MASISLIDETVEIFKAEYGFNRKYVDRRESIGAHVLLSDEPMVLLDVTKVCNNQSYPRANANNCLGLAIKRKPAS